MTVTSSIEAPMHLEELFTTVESISGLEVSVYPADKMVAASSIDGLPVGFRRHMSAFCRLVKGRNRRGCQGFDSRITNRRAGEVGRVFVQRCHAGVAEAVVPVFGQSGHLATVLVGQVVTEAVAAEGFDGVWRRVGSGEVDRELLRRAYGELPRIAEHELLRIGRLLDCALRGMVGGMDAEMLEREMSIQQFPQVRNALRILAEERCWHISQAEMARRVHVSTAHFSRLFKRVVGHTFSDYLTELRMSEAQNLLHHTKLTVNDIARRLGYSRQSYFTRRFRAVTGLTPSGYRRNRR